MRRNNGSRNKCRLPGNAMGMCPSLGSDSSIFITAAGRSCWLLVSPADCSSLLQVKQGIATALQIHNALCKYLENLLFFHWGIDSVQYTLESHHTGRASASTSVSSDGQCVCVVCRQIENVMPNLWWFRSNILNWVFLGCFTSPAPTFLKRKQVLKLEWPYCAQRTVLVLYR